MYNEKIIKRHVSIGKNLFTGGTRVFKADVIYSGVIVMQ